jgi:hypothetical protein
MKQFKKILLIVVFLCGVANVFAQGKHISETPARKKFNQLLKETNLQFAFPSGFREIAPVDNDDFSYDYAMELPGRDFEVWIQVKSQRQNWISYDRARYDKTQKELANPDSMYVDMSKADATALSGDSSILVRSMTPEILARYNADVGKSYLINLPDLDITKHYKYALLVALQKSHTGTLIAVYFTNEKDADFYREVYRAAHCLRFMDKVGR